MRENTQQFFQYATKTWIALTVEILVTTFLFVCFNLVGIPKDISILLTVLVAVISVLIGVKITSRDKSEISLIPTVQKSVLKEPIQSVQPEKKPIEPAQSERLVYRSSSGLLLGKLIIQPQIKDLVQVLTKQSNFEIICASHLERHQNSQRSAWSKVEPASLFWSSDNVSHEWYRLLISGLDEQLHIEQAWINPLVWILTQQSQIKQKSVQGLLDSSNTYHWVTLLIKNLTLESSLEKSCARQIKWNVDLQKKTIQKWLVLLEQGLAEDKNLNMKGIELLLQQMDKQTRSEQEVATLLKRSLDIQKRTEQLWISEILQYLKGEDHSMQAITKLWMPNEQMKAEQELLETLFLKHIEEDNKAEIKPGEMPLFHKEEQAESETHLKSQTWQNFIDSIEQRLDKQIQIKQEIAENLAESLEERSQVKEQAADLLEELTR